ncbi:hypothetical protein SKAU_G00089840 [Synaphobranchus kaupii]|uniref:Uncharacterized protein n=1 Tax=Synaphobranchus kaupii TaxID=118154 RepID=A0A9Q1J6C0_SYNKA|nr:hypothetical protein SKAU_G00089840 [Synaphobranchus kaupii]
MLFFHIEKKIPHLRREGEARDAGYVTHGLWRWRNERVSCYLNGVSVLQHVPESRIESAKNRHLWTAFIGQNKGLHDETSYNGVYRVYHLAE